jgi:dTDP-glucose 4,6-dehydratase
MRKLKNILVTGGSGFIGSNFIRWTFEKENFEGNIINLDKLTHGSSKDNLKDIETKYKDRYFFELGDIIDKDSVKNIFEKYNIDTVVHFAAESHVDRSIQNPEDFIKTNVLGTFVLLDCAKRTWANRKDVLFHHISTDEVYGSLGETGYFYEDSNYDPRSPYSASKASSDHLVNAYYHTYDLNITISNCSNNYGPYQNEEKLIPLMLHNMLNNIKLPVYGDGKNIRDWLFVDDHSSAIWYILKNGKLGEKYNIGGENEWNNIDLVNFLCKKTAEKMGKDENFYKNLIDFVKDRLGHDRRYAVNCDKLKKLGWKRQFGFEYGIDNTIEFYIEKHNK